jgi:hypothetical protein
MTEIPRRTLDELAFLYDQNRDCRDIITEGPFKAAIVRWFLQSLQVRSVAVYSIDAFEIPDGEILAAGRKANNRERVMFLSEFLTSRSFEQATCVVDADFSHLTGSAASSGSLLMTDYSCLEMYFYRADVLSKFFIVCCLRPHWPVEEIMGAMAQVLVELFLLRFANEELRWEMDWVDRIVCMKATDWRIIFDLSDYVKRLLNKNGRAAQKVIFLDKVKSLRSKLRDDPRYQMHGHDFSRLLAWLVREKGVSPEHCRAETILKFLALAANYEELTKTSLFSNILRRVRSSNGDREAQKGRS